MLSVAIFYQVLAADKAKSAQNEDVAGNITFVGADLQQWEPLGSSYSSMATFHRDGNGSAEISGNFTFSLPEDAYSARAVSFKNWTRDTDLTVRFNYTVPADGCAGALSPALKLDVDGNVSVTFDYLNETGRYVFNTFTIADPEPDKNNLGNDDLSTLVPPGYYDQRFVDREADAYNNSLNASKALTLGAEPYCTRDLAGAMKNVTASVNHQMVHDVDRWQNDPYYGDFTQSDWYLGYNQSGFGPRYHGICKDYASLARSYYRSMGIPAKFLICVMNDKDGKLASHAWLEVYDGSRWIQADPAMNVFDDPGHYKDLGYSAIQIRELSVCQKKADSKKSSGAADDLIFQAWLYWDPPDRLDFETVIDRGFDPTYN